MTKLAAMAKLKGGRLCREVSDSCVQYLGGFGFTENLVSRMFLDGRYEEQFIRSCALLTSHAVQALRMTQN